MAAPHYVFQCRPTEGNKHLSVPVERAYRIHEQAKMLGSGLAKRSRLVMSHALGKIEVLGLSEDHIFFRYHRSADLKEKERFIVYKRKPEAYWFDDYTEQIEDYSIENPFLVSAAVREGDLETVS